VDSQDSCCNQAITLTASFLAQLVPLRFSLIDVDLWAIYSHAQPRGASSLGTTSTYAELNKSFSDSVRCLVPYNPAGHSPVHARQSSQDIHDLPDLA
jgi:hypothetical protein